MSNHRLAQLIAAAAQRRGCGIAVAESLTGGLVSQQLAAAPEAAEWFRGAVIAYASDVKFDVLQVPHGPVVSEAAARAMAHGVARLLKADFAVATTGAGGPDPQDGQPPGTVWVAVHAHGRTHARLLRLAGNPARICAHTTTEALRLLAECLDEAPQPSAAAGDAIERRKPREPQEA